MVNKKESIEFEIISRNGKIMRNLIKSHVPSERMESIINMISSNEIQERIMVVPYASRTDYSGCFVGGLLDMSIKIYSTMNQLNQTYNAKINQESLLITAFFHDLGKIGSLESDSFYYIKNDSKWHNDRGIIFDINDKMSSLPVSQRSLFLLQHYKVNLTEDEYNAIASIKDKIRNGEDNLPSNNDTLLSIILQQAIKIVCFKNKKIDSITKTEILSFSS